MKTNKFIKILSVGLLAATLQTTIVNAAPNTTTTPANGQATIAPTTVTITKLGSGSWDQAVTTTGLVNTDGVALSDSQIASLGTNVTRISGVEFTYFKVSENATREQLNDAVLKAKAAKMTLADYLKANKSTYGIAAADNGTAVALTNGSGVTTWSWNPPTGTNKTENFWVVETKAPENVAEGRAVPFQITFPMSAENGTGYLTNVNIYPKNDIANLPTPGKDVNALGTNLLGSTVGSEVKFFLKGSIPTNIQVYESYVFTDVLDSALTFKNVASVKYGAKSLTVGTHYAVTTSTVETNKTQVVVSLTPAGIQAIATNTPENVRNQVADIANASVNSDAAPFIQVELNTTLNDKAVAGKAIENKTTITFDNTPDGVANPKTPVTSDTVVVATGGKVFAKQDQATNAKLEDAQFTLHASRTSPALQWTAELIQENLQAIQAGKFVAADGNPTSASKLPVAGEVITLRSGTNGEFEISGLAFGGTSNSTTPTTVFNSASTNYFLKEIKAPAGYVIPNDPFVQFTVNKNSFYTDPSATTLVKAANQDVNNKQRPIIPATGGIGTIVFVIAGGALILFAIKQLKKEEKQ